MEKRFIYGSLNQWNGALAANEAKYKDSIVFIIDDSNAKNGVKIYTQGAYFDTELSASEVKDVIVGYLSNGKNITITAEEGALKIAATSVDDLKGKKDSTLLVEAKAVAGALTTPVNLTMNLSNGVATFSETFTTLNGDTTQAVTAVFKEGSYIDFTEDGGLKISVDKASLATDLKTDLNYGDGNVITVDNEKRTINHNEITKTTANGTAINPSATSKSFDIKSYEFDKYGHIATETTTVVTLPDTAFTDENTEYELSVAKQEGDSGKAQYDVNLVNKADKSIADTVTLVPGANVAMALNGTKGIEVIATDTKYEVDATANATAGVDVNLKGTDNSTDSVTFVGGSNVTVALNDGKVEISSSFENDNTTYTGENAIVVDQPEEGKTEGKVSLKIDESDLFLSQSGDGLKANIEVAYDSATNFIYLKGVGATDKTAGFDASAFVKDSFVESVTYVDQDDKGKTGKFLKFVFVVVDQDGQKEFEKTTTTTYVDVTDLVNTIYDVEGDNTTYSVVEESIKEDGTVLFTVKNTIGNALEYTYQTSNANTKVTITAPKAGLVDTEILTSAISNIGSDKLATEKLAAENKTAAEGEIAVVTGVHQSNGHIVSVDAGLAATKSYVDAAIDALDVDGDTIGSVATETDTVNVIDSLTWSETNGKVSITGTTTTAATKKYVDDTVGAIKHSTVEASTDKESATYLSVTPGTNENGSAKYTVKVSGIDTAISTAVTNAVEALDSNINVDAQGVIQNVNAHDGKIYESLEIKDGKLVQGASTATRIKYIDNAKLTNINTNNIKYTGITKDDTIATAFEKVDAAWEWGTLTV